MIAIISSSLRIFTVILCLSFLTACSGGSYNQTSVQMEKINGIEVPPEPDSAKNNATLEGVDVNRNGIRDDIERIAARDPLYKAETDKPIFLEYQKIIGHKSTSVDEVGNAFLKIVCFYNKNPNALDLEKKILNTDDRIKAFNSAQAIALSSSTYPIVIDNKTCKGK